MLPRIRSAAPLGDYRLHLTFTDGATGTVDLRPDVAGRGGVFAPLASPEYFAQVAVDSDAGTVVWPNGLDLDPDVLYHRATGRPLPRPGAAPMGAAR